MATSSEINFIGEGATATGGSNCVIESFKYSGVIVKGDLVCLDPSASTLIDTVKTVKAVDHTDALERQLVVGVALEGTAGLDSESIQVVVAGGPVLAKAAATVAAGNQLVASAAAGATVLPAVQADTAGFPTLVGVALEDDGATLAGFANIFVFGLYNR